MPATGEIAKANDAAIVSGFGTLTVISKFDWKQLDQHRNIVFILTRIS